MLPGKNPFYSRALLDEGTLRDSSLDSEDGDCDHYRQVYMDKGDF